MDGKQPRSNRSAAADATSQIATIGVEDVRQLVRLLDKSDVSEVELKSTEQGLRLILRKVQHAVGESASGPIVVSEQVSDNTDATTESPTRHTIVAPLVGIFHSWAKPRGGTLVAVGDQVKVGQLVATIESLNVINEVESTVAGRVIEVFLQDGQPVEYGQPLMVVDSVKGA